MPHHTDAGTLPHHAKLRRWGPVCLTAAFSAILLFVLAPSQAYGDASCERLAEHFEGEGISFIARCGSPIPDSLAVHECKFPAMQDWVTYLPAEPTIHYIEGGDFVALCVMPENYWFDVFLNTHSPGRMVIEIPKDAVDLKQFDFPHCLSPGHVWVLDDLNVPTESVTMRQIQDTGHSRILQIEWDYSGVRMISYGGADVVYRHDWPATDVRHPGQCIKEYVDGGHDPSESIRHTSIGNAARHVCHDYDRFTMVDFVRNITTGSVESMCLERDKLMFVIDVEEDGHLLLDIPHDVLGARAIGSAPAGNYEAYYRWIDRDFFADAAPYSAFSSDGWWPGDGGSYTSSIYNKYGAYPIHMLQVALHSFDADSTTFRVPFLKEDVVFRAGVGPAGSFTVPKHVMEKYAVPFTPAPPRMQSQHVLPEDVVCRDGLVRAFKPGSPACDESLDWLRANTCSDITSAKYTAVCVKQSSLDVLADRCVLHAGIPADWAGSKNPNAWVITYTIVGGDVTSILQGTNDMPGFWGAMFISINATDDGYVTLTIPRTVADSHLYDGSGDDSYFVLVDGERVYYKESKTDYARTLTIDFAAGSEKIEIIGTFVVAEFDIMEKERVMPPLKQVRQGVPVEQVSCNGNKIPMATPSGMPTCVYPESAEKLVDREFEKICQAVVPANTGVFAADIAAHAREDPAESP